jgi:hypothetical protein
MRVQVRFHPKAAGTRSHVVRLSMIRYTTSGPNDTVRDIPHFNLVGIGTEESPPPLPPNDSPDLRNGWYLNSSPQAFNTYYYSTYCTDGGAVSTATWEGSVPQAGNYKVEVFIPRQGFSVTPRTNNATYQIFHAGAGGQATAAISQNVTSSDWVSLGTFAFQASYRIVLTDQTGEPIYSHWVIADAVRLTPAP